MGSILDYQETEQSSPTMVSPHREWNSKCFPSASARSTFATPDLVTTAVPLIEVKISFPRDFAFTEVGIDEAGDANISRECPLAPNVRTIPYPHCLPYTPPDRASARRRRRIESPSRRASDDRARDDDGDRARDDDGDDASTTTARRIESHKRRRRRTTRRSGHRSIERRCSRRARAGRRRADARREIESTRAWTRWCAR